MSSSSNNMVQMLLTRNEEIFVRMAKFFGVGIFKKYFPRNGSYWNNTHMDSENVLDVRCIINRTETYSREIFWNLLIIMWMLCGMRCAGYLSGMQTGKIFLIFFICYIYALLVQYFNSIMARGRLRYLEQLEPRVEAHSSTPHICLFKVNDECYHAQFDTCQIGPYFVNEIDCRYFIDYLVLIYNLEEHKEQNLTKFYEDIRDETIDTNYDDFKDSFMLRQDDQISSDDKMLDLFLRYIDEH